MKYLYIFEDGRVGVADTPPTTVDRDCIGDGLLQVFQLSVGSDESESLDHAVVDVQEFDSSGGLVEAPTAVLAVERLSEDSDGDFHIPE